MSCDFPVWEVLVWLDADFSGLSHCIYLALFGIDVIVLFAKYWKNGLYEFFFFLMPSDASYWELPHYTCMLFGFVVNVLLAKSC